MRKQELKELKITLTKRREQIIKNLDGISKDLIDLQGLTSSDEFDVASINTDSNLEYSLSAKQKSELKAIDEALSRIDDGRYGVCEMCEDEITLARLKVNPSTKLCITCKEIVEKNNK